MAIVNYHVMVNISNTSKTGKFQILQKLNTPHSLTANRKKKSQGKLENT